jgi:hypothetical protein
MKGESFELLPFAGNGLRHPRSITARIARRSGVLGVRYELSGDLDRIRIPQPAPVTFRRHRLWEETCFELFFAPVERAFYWEVNLSPAGHWNVYRFDDYRRGMRDEPALSTLPFTVRRGADLLRLEMELDLCVVPEWRGPLEAGISAVIRMGDGSVSYWALAHPDPRADFHRRESFIARLD